MDKRLKGRTDRPDNDKDIIMWKFDVENTELTVWHYLDGELTPKERWIYDPGSDYDGTADNPGMVYLDATEKEINEELGHPTFGEAKDKWPCWDYEDKLYEIIGVIDDEVEELNPFIRCQFYSYYASYFINGDSSGLTDDEIQDCEAFADACERYLGTSKVVDIIDCNGFGDVEIPLGYRVKGYNGVKFLPGDVVTYVLEKKK